MEVILIICQIGTLKHGKPLICLGPQDFRLWFFHESVFSEPLSKPLGPFRIFSKIRLDIHSSRCTTDVVDTGGKWKKSSIRKFLIILFGHLWVVELTLCR